MRAQYTKIADLEKQEEQVLVFFVFFFTVFYKEASKLGISCDICEH